MLRWSKDPLKGRKRFQAINTMMLIIERDQKELLVCDGARVDVLYIDWYEVNKTLLTRQTEGGVLFAYIVELLLRSNAAWLFMLLQNGVFK